MVKGDENDKGKGKKVAKDESKPRRPKYEWSNEEVELLIKLLVEEAQLQIGRGGSLVGFQHRWGNITERFNAAREGMEEVDRAQLKNKGDTLKGGWRKWKDLTHKQTGLGWNEAGNCCTYPPEWVARKAQENRAMYKLINSKWPAHLVDDMELIWGQSYATGELRITPGGTAPIQYEQIESDDAGCDGTETDNMENQSGNLDFSAEGNKCVSMDMSGGNNKSDMYGAVGSNRNRVNAPLNGGTGDSSAPFFDLTTAAEFGAALTASAFQGSPFGGIVAGSSSGFMPFVDGTNANHNLGSIQLTNNSVGNGKDKKPSHWDELMKTTAGPIPHGGKRKQANVSVQPNEVKKKSKGSKGKAAAVAEELKELQSGVNDTLRNCSNMLGTLDAVEFGGNRNSVISVQEAASVIRGIPGLTREEVTNALMLIANRSHRAVLMTLIDEEEIADWVRHLYKFSMSNNQN